MQKETSTVIEYIEDECEFSSAEYESLSDLHSSYSEFCKKSGYRSLGIKNFRKALESDERVEIVRANYGTQVNGITMGRILPAYLVDQSKAIEV